MSLSEAVDTERGNERDREREWIPRESETEREGSPGSQRLSMPG